MGGVYLSEAQNPPPPLYTLYTCMCIPVYLFTQGRGEIEPERRLNGLAVHKAESKIPT